MFKKTRKYSKQTTAKEVYERVCFYKLIVEDKSGIIDKKNDDFLDKMFEAFENHRLNAYCGKIDPKKYNVRVVISDLGSDKFAEVEITKRTIFQRMSAVFRSH